MNEEQILKLIQNPLILFVVMLLGGLTSIAKQIKNARDNGNTTITFATYLQHWPEMLMAGAVLIAAFVGMIESHTLNFVSAWGTGFASNSLADLAKGGERSAAMLPPKSDDPPQDDR